MRFGTAVHGALALLILCSVPIVGIGASERAPRDDALDDLAAKLTASFKSSVRVAVQPVGMGSSGLPADLAARLDTMILSAMRRRAPRRVTLMSRGDLEAAWAEAIEFSDRKVQDLLREARADVLITADVVALPAALEVSLRATSLREGKVGRLLSAPRPAHLTIPDLDLDALRFKQALWRAADALAASAVARLDVQADGKLLDVAAADGGGEFVRHARELALIRLRALLSRLSRRASVPLNATAPPREVLYLDLEALDQGDAVSITLKLTGSGVAVSRVARIDMNVIPAHFLPLTRDGGSVGVGMIQGRGGAWRSESLTERQVRAAARALARARVVASAFGLSMPYASDVGTAEDMIALRRMMERGIPHGEVWVSDVQGVDGDVSVKLRALARPIGGAAAPRMGIAFSGSDLRAGDTLKMLISAKRRPAYVAVFSWDSVDGVQQLYPAGGAEAIRVEAGATLVLPPPSGPRYGVAPMLGQRVTAESLIVLGSTVPFDTTGLAPVPRDVGRSTPFQARPVSRFFDALARRDLAVMTVRILDYRVRDSS